MLTNENLREELNKYGGVAAFRPFVEEGKSFILIDNTKRPFKPNEHITMASLSKEKWLELDTQVAEATSYSMPLTESFSKNRKTTTGVKGFPKVLDVQSDTTGTFSDLSFSTVSLPIPILYQECTSGTLVGVPKKYVMVAIATRVVCEVIEKTTIGLDDQSRGIINSKGVIKKRLACYDYLNWNQFESTMKNTTGGVFSYKKDCRVEGCNSVKIGILELKSILRRDKFYPPYLVLYSWDWNVVMDEDYIEYGQTTPTKTLRRAIRDVDGVEDVLRCPALPNKTLVMLSPDSVNVIEAIKPTLIQTSNDTFAIVACMMSQVRDSYYKKVGIVLGVDSEV